MVNYLCLQAKERRDLKCSPSESGEPSPLPGFGQAVLPHVSSASAGIFCVNGQEVRGRGGLALGKTVLLTLLLQIILSLSALQAEQSSFAYRLGK